MLHYVLKYLAAMSRDETKNDLCLAVLPLDRMSRSARHQIQPIYSPECKNNALANAMRIAVTSEH